MKRGLPVYHLFTFYSCGVMTLNQTTQYSCQKSLRFHVHIRKKDAKAFNQNQVLTICKQNTYLLFIHLLVHFDSVMLKSGDIGVIF